MILSNPYLELAKAWMNGTIQYRTNLHHTATHLKLTTFYQEREFGM